MDEQIDQILCAMSSALDNEELALLKETLTHVLTDPSPLCSNRTNQDMLDLFISAKKVEGCSLNTLSYYEATISKALSWLSKPLLRIQTDDLRRYLSDYQATRGASPVTMNNMRRVLSSFFAWLEDEEIILKSPMRRIKPIRTPQRVKETFSNEEIELMREAVRCPRDLAIVDLLNSTGMRVGELVGLNRRDFNLEKHECVVTGKGNKERTVYFDDRTKLHLEAYFESRKDSLEAAFASLSNHNRRLGKDGVQKMIHLTASRAGVARAFPHKFRRTLATRAIGKGMPIEQVQHLLGHKRIDTTLHYAMVNEANVKISHQRFIC